MLVVAEVPAGATTSIHVSPWVREKDDAVTRTLVRALDGDAEPWNVLPVLAQRSRQRGLPPPAALIGDWFGGAAVIAPSVRIRAVPAGRAFPPGSAGEVGGPVGGGWIGYLGYGLADPRPAVRRLPLAAGGWAVITGARALG